MDRNLVIVLAGLGALGGALGFVAEITIGNSVAIAQEAETIAKLEQNELRLEDKLDRVSENVVRICERLEIGCR